MARKVLEPNISYDTDRNLYYVYLDAGLDPLGKRCRCYRTAPTLPQARKLLHNFREQKTSGQMLRPTSQTLGQWLTYWLEEIIQPTRASTTVYSYRQIIQNHLLPALGELPLQQLAPLSIQRYYTMLLQEKFLSPNTIRRHHDLLSAALRAAVRQEILPYCPTDRVEPPRQQPSEARFYRAEDLRRLFLLVQDSSLEVPVRLAAMLGLRREEICGLKWKHVDFEHNLIHICQVRTSAGSTIVEKEPKNASSLRTLHMTIELSALLRREYHRQNLQQKTLGVQWQDTDLVVVSENGTPPAPNALSAAFTRFVKAHTLPPLTLHGLRHSFATVASHEGIPLFEIGKALGHSTPTTTGKVYTHLTDSTHASALTRVAAAVR